MFTSVCWIRRWIPPALVAVVLVPAAWAAPGFITVTARDSTVKHNGAANEAYIEISPGVFVGGVDPAYPPYTDAVSEVSLTAPFATGVMGLAKSYFHSYEISTAADQFSGLNYDLDDHLLGLNADGGALVRAQTSFLPNAGGGSGNAESFFDVFFTVNLDPVAFPLHVVLSVGIAHSTLAIDPGKASFRLDHVGFGTIVDIEANILTPSASYHNSLLVLDPGVYHLQADAKAFNSCLAYGPTDTINSASFSVVPEPGAITLLGLPLLILTRRRHRRGEVPPGSNPNEQ